MFCIPQRNGRGVWRVWDTGGVHTGFRWGDLRVGKHLENIGGDGRIILKCIIRIMVRQPRCVFINYNWINQLSNTSIWWLDICCLLHSYQLHVSALMAIFRLID